MNAQAMHFEDRLTKILTQVDGVEAKMVQRESRDRKLRGWVEEIEGKIEKQGSQTTHPSQFSTCTSMSPIPEKDIFLTDIKTQVISRIKQLEKRLKSLQPKPKEEGSVSPGPKVKTKSKKLKKEDFLRFKEEYHTNHKDQQEKFSHLWKEISVLKTDLEQKQTMKFKKMYLRIRQMRDQQQEEIPRFKD